MLLFSDEVVELLLPLFALRVLRLLAIGISGNVPTMGVAVFDARPARVVVMGAGAGASDSLFSGSCVSASSCFKVAVGAGSNGGSSVVSFGVDASLMDALSRMTPAACSSSVMALLLVVCGIECDDEGRLTTGISGAAEATDVAVEFFLAREAVGRSVLAMTALGRENVVVIGDDAGGGEYAGTACLR